MKKAKIMLSAIAVFAIVGGAFAFKAARTPRILFYPTDAAKSFCTNPTLVLLSTTNIPQAAGITYYTTTPTTTGCPTYTITSL